MLPQRIASKLDQIRRRALYLLRHRPGGWRRRYQACCRDEARWCRGRNPTGWRMPSRPRRCHGFTRFHGEAAAIERIAISAAINRRVDRPALAPDGQPWE